MRITRPACSTLAALALAGACDRRNTASAGDPASAPSPPRAPARLVLDLYAFGRTRGAVAPCGCTTEPLGGLDLAFGVVDDPAARGHRVVVEPGSLLFPDPADAEAPKDEAGWQQAADRAEVLHGRFSGLDGGLVSGLGPLDLASPQGAAALDRFPLPRVLANLAPSDDDARPWATKLPGHRLVPLTVGGRKLQVGVTAVVDPSAPLADRLGPLAEPQASLTREVQAMRAAGADLTVALVHGPRARAEALARAVSGLDLAVVGLVEGTERQRLGAPPSLAGDTFVVEPGEQLQTVSHVRLSFAPEAKLAGADRWQLVPSRAEREAELARVRERLAKFEGDPAADPAFLARLRTERDALQAALAGDAPPPGAPVAATIEQIKVTCHGRRDPAAQAALAAYDRKVAERNKARFVGVKPPPPAKSKPGYVGVEECEMCHDEAAAFWKTTRHAQAFATLEHANKQYDLSCVGCHVTGFRKPGGSEVVENQGLRNVQCEVCHGPGSLHAEDGDTRLVERAAPQTVCAACHTPEHSDTFDYRAYLRDILGPGHGEQARKALGDGPTGHELRAAGLAKAGGACPKDP